MRFAILFHVAPELALEVRERCRSILKDNQPQLTPADNGMRAMDWDYQWDYAGWLRHGLRVWANRQFRKDVLSAREAGPSH